MSFIYRKKNYFRAQIIKSNIMKKHIPNLITCMNVTSGTVAIYAAFHGYLYLAAWLVILAMVFDFFDGFRCSIVAREVGNGRGTAIPWPTWLVSG